MGYRNIKHCKNNQEFVRLDTIYHSGNSAIFSAAEKEKHTLIKEFCELKFKIPRGLAYQ